MFRTFLIPCRKFMNIKFIQLICVLALLLTMSFTDNESKSSQRLKEIRKKYNVYYKFDWIKITEMLAMHLRVDKRGLPGCNQKPADVIMIGVPKCGSGAVRYSIGEHPDVAMDLNSEGVEYFSTRYERGVLWYVSQMPCSKQGQLTAENTVQYFMDEEAPQRIAKFNPAMKLIVTVREPIQRLISEFVQMQAGGPQFLLGEALEENIFHKKTGNVLEVPLVTKSLYSVHLRRWLEYFNSSQIHVVNGDMFVDDPVSELVQIEQFLGIRSYFDYKKFAFVEERGFFCFQRIDHVECLESGKGRKHPEVNEETIEKLKAYFRPYNKAFFKLIGKDFHWNT